jgi:hypothetical protein
MLIFAEGGKPENPEKNPRSKGENQQQTQLTYDGKSGNRTRVTVVRGERSTTTPPMLPINQQCSHYLPTFLLVCSQRYVEAFSIMNDLVVKVGVFIGLCGQLPT